MSDTVAMRLPTGLLKQLRKFAKVQRKTRSAVIREALEDFFSRRGPSSEKDPYRALMALMPLEKSGLSDLASQSEKYIRKKFRDRSRPH